MALLRLIFILPLPFLLTLISNVYAQPESRPLTLPTAETRRAMVLKLSAEMLRLDGDGFIPRANRPTSWQDTITQLATEAENAKNPFELGRVFKRLDAAYPNLHAFIRMRSELNEAKTIGEVNLPILFRPTKVGRSLAEVQFRLVVPKDKQSELRTGDELVAINSRPLRVWLEENFNFCKFPLREQCTLEFYDNFRKELLSWNRHQPLELTVRRGSQELVRPLTPNSQSGGDEHSLDTPTCGIK